MIKAPNNKQRRTAATIPALLRCLAPAPSFSGDTGARLIRRRFRDGDFESVLGRGWRQVNPVKQADRPTVKKTETQFLCGQLPAHAVAFKCPAGGDHSAVVSQIWRVGHAVARPRADPTSRRRQPRRAVSRAGRNGLIAHAQTSVQRWCVRARTTRLRRKVGRLRTAGKADGLTKAKAERALRRMLELDRSSAMP